MYTSCWKPHNGRDRRPNLLHSVVYSGLIVGGWVMSTYSKRSYLGLAEIMYMCESPIEIVECIWLNIWCMLDWIWSQNCGNTLFLYTCGQIRGAQKIRRCLYIRQGIRHRPDGAISDCESWGISGSWFAKCTEGKKGTTIAWWKLSLKKHLPCNLVQ